MSKKMNHIVSVITEDDKEKKKSYAFEVNGEKFVAHHKSGEKPSLEILHNDVSLGIITQIAVPTEYLVNHGDQTIKIDAFIQQPGGFLDFLMPWKKTGNGIHLTVDGVPVQGTIDDPEVNIREGFLGLWFLLAIFILKTVVGFVVDGFGGAIYLIPLIIILLAVIRFNKWTGFAVHAGLILSVLEFIEYILGAFGSQSVISIIIWSLIRAGIFVKLLSAFQFYRKEKKAHM